MGALLGLQLARCPPLIKTGVAPAHMQAMQNHWALASRPRLMPDTAAQQPAVAGCKLAHN